MSAAIADLECRLAAAEPALRGKSHVEAALRPSEELRRIAIQGGHTATWRWNLRDKNIWGDAAFLDLWDFPASDELCRHSDFTDRMTVATRMTDEADDITWLVPALAKEADASSAADGPMVERLRRMEDEARLGGTDRQTLQLTMSARRVPGHRMDFGPVKASLD